MQNLIEELTKVDPANLSEEGLKLFNKINEIIDRNKELEEYLEVTSKALDNVAYDQIPIAIADLKYRTRAELDTVYIKARYDERDKWESLIKEKIEELEDYFYRLNGPDEDIEYIKEKKKELLKEEK